MVLIPTVVMKSLRKFLVRHLVSVDEKYVKESKDF